MREGFMIKESQRKRKMENGNSGNENRNWIGRNRKRLHRGHGGRRERREEKISDEEIEEDEEEAEKEKDGAAIKAAARKAADGADHGSRDSLEARIFARDIEGTDDGIAGEVAPEDREFILKIDEEIAAMAPNERGTHGANKIAEKCKGPERRACSPIHKSS
jgi:hypothetical protein